MILDDAGKAAAAASLGLALRSHRQAAGLTLQHVADAAQLSKSYLSDCERGRRLPSLPALVEIADALGTDAQRLLQATWPFSESGRRPPS